MRSLQVVACLLFAEDLSALLVVLVDLVEVIDEALRPLVLVLSEPIQCVSLEDDRANPGSIRAALRAAA
jgi:hypothetical protein